MDSTQEAASSAGATSGLGIRPSASTLGSGSHNAPRSATRAFPEEDYIPLGDVSDDEMSRNSEMWDAEQEDERPSARKGPGMQPTASASSGTDSNRQQAPLAHNALSQAASTEPTATAAAGRTATGAMATARGSSHRHRRHAGHRSDDSDGSGSGDDSYDSDEEEDGASSSSDAPRKSATQGADQLRRRRGEVIHDWLLRCTTEPALYFAAETTASMQARLFTWYDDHRQKAGRAQDDLFTGVSLRVLSSFFGRQVPLLVPVHMAAGTMMYSVVWKGAGAAPPPQEPLWHLLSREESDKLREMRTSFAFKTDLKAWLQQCATRADMYFENQTAAELQAKFKQWRQTDSIARTLSAGSGGSGGGGGAFTNDPKDSTSAFALSIRALADLVYTSAARHGTDCMRLSAHWAGKGPKPVPAGGGAQPTAALAALALAAAANPDREQKRVAIQQIVARELAASEARLLGDATGDSSSGSSGSAAEAARERVAQAAADAAAAALAAAALAEPQPSPSASSTHRPAQFAVKRKAGESASSFDSAVRSWLAACSTTADLYFREEDIAAVAVHFHAWCSGAASAGASSSSNSSSSSGDMSSGSLVTPKLSAVQLNRFDGVEQSGERFSVTWAGAGSAPAASGRRIALAAMQAVSAYKDGDASGKLDQPTATLLRRRVVREWLLQCSVDRDQYWAGLRPVLLGQRFDAWCVATFNMRAPYQDNNSVCTFGQDLCSFAHASADGAVPKLVVRPPTNAPHRGYSLLWRGAGQAPAGAHMPTNSISVPPAQRLPSLLRSAVPAPGASSSSSSTALRASLGAHTRKALMEADDSLTDEDVGTDEYDEHEEDDGRRGRSEPRMRSATTTTAAAAAAAATGTTDQANERHMLREWLEECSKNEQQHWQYLHAADILRLYGEWQRAKHPGRIAITADQHYHVPTFAKRLATFLPFDDDPTAGLLVRHAVRKNEPWLYSVVWRGDGDGAGRSSLPPPPQPHEEAGAPATTSGSTTTPDPRRSSLAAASSATVSGHKRDRATEAQVTQEAQVTPRPRHGGGGSSAGSGGAALALALAGAASSPGYWSLGRSSVTSTVTHTSTSTLVTPPLKRARLDAAVTDSSGGSSAMLLAAPSSPPPPPLPAPSSSSLLPSAELQLQSADVLRVAMRAMIVKKVRGELAAAAAAGDFSWFLMRSYCLQRAAREAAAATAATATAGSSDDPVLAGFDAAMNQIAVQSKMSWTSLADLCHD